MHKCMFCSKKYDKDKRGSFYNHLEREHGEDIPNDIPISQFYFNYRNKKDGGVCVICGKSTSWNNTTEKYERICSANCKKTFRERFKERMIKNYGKVHLLDDPNMQRKMIANRKISGRYKFSDGGEVGYVGSYEHDFLEFLDKFMNMSSNDIIECDFEFYYTYKGKKHFYIPDFYIPSLNLIVEIKEGGNNPNTHGKIQSVDKEKEKLKDEVVMLSGKYNYLKLTDKNNKLFLDFLVELRDKDEDNDNPIFIIGENFDLIKENIKNGLLSECNISFENDIFEDIEFFTDVNLKEILYNDTDASDSILESTHSKYPLTNKEREKIYKKFGVLAKKVGWAKDEKGIYCMTHRCRSKSYENVEDIPISKVKFVESTG